MLFFQEPFSEFGLGIVYSYVYISQCRKKVVDRGGGGKYNQLVSESGSIQLILNLINVMVDFGSFWQVPHVIVQVLSQFVLF